MRMYDVSGVKSAVDFIWFFPYYIHTFYFTINDDDWNQTGDMLSTELNNLTSSSSRAVDVVQVSAVSYIS